MATNWLAVERDYCAGVLPLDAICLRHSISETNLKKYAKDHGWKRGDYLQDNRKYLQVIDPDDVRETVITGSTVGEVFTPDELEKAALITASALVELHRQDFSQARKHLNEMTTWVMERKRNMPLPHPTDDIKEHGMAAKVQSIILTSYAACVGSLAKIVQLERQTYDLDNYQGEKTVNNALDEQNALLTALKSELNDLMEAKSAYAGDVKTIYESEPLIAPEEKK